MVLEVVQTQDFVQQNSFLLVLSLPSVGKGAFVMNHSGKKFASFIKIIRTLCTKC